MPGRVGLGESFGDLGGEIEEAPGRERLSRGEQLAQGLSLDELHGDVEGAVGLADVVDGQDVGVVESGGRSGFLLEA